MSEIKAFIVPFSCSQKVGWIVNSKSEQNCKRTTVKNLKQRSLYCKSSGSRVGSRARDIFRFYLFMKPNFCRFPGFMFCFAIKRVDK